MYNRLFSSIINSSIWSEDSDTCKVWVTLLAMQDRKGYVFGSALGLARICGLEVGVVEAAIEKFTAPDPHSADLSRGGDGRRLEVVGGGWLLLNADYYNSMFDAEARRESNRAAAKAYRARKSPRRHQSVGNRQPSESEVESEVDVDAGEKKERVQQTGPLPAVPIDLVGLELYEKDARLCRRWNQFKASALVAYPGVDVVAEVRKAHAWEVNNPTQRKRSRTRFLNAWLSRAQDRAPRPQGQGGRPAPGPAPFLKLPELGS